MKKGAKGAVASESTGSKEVKEIIVNQCRRDTNMVVKLHEESKRLFVVKPKAKLRPFYAQEKRRAALPVFAKCSL